MMDQRSPQFMAKGISAAETRVLRHTILWPHRPHASDCTIDVDEAPHAFHVGAFDAEGRHVGVCSLFEQRSERFPLALPTDDPVYRLRVMGTLPAVRGQGAGATIIAFAREWCQNRGAQWLWCDAREVAFPFYQRVGFDFCSDHYEIDPIGTHRMMVMKL